MIKNRIVYFITFFSKHNVLTNFFNLPFTIETQMTSHLHLDIEDDNLLSLYFGVFVGDFPKKEVSVSQFLNCNYLRHIKGSIIEITKSVLI